MKTQIPLSHPPQLISLGRARHGLTALEHYRFDDYWCLQHYHYSFKLVLDGVTHHIEEGSVSLIPPGVRMTYHFPKPACHHEYSCFILQDGPSRHAFAVITPPAQVPADLGENFQLAASEYRERPEHATALIWTILWQLARDTTPRQYCEHPLVNRACRIIENHLAEPLSVAGLAEELGVSHNHLTRQFQAALGQGVSGTIVERRMAHARALLRETTLPIKVIARECGLPDPHAFNKAFRRLVGTSPSAYRRQG